MVTLAYAVVAYLRSLFLPRHKLALEAVALRQQLAVFKRKQPRPKLDRLDRLFWMVLRRLWEGWSSPHHRQAGDRGLLASCRIPAVLAVAVSATSTGATTGECADPPVHSTHEGGESHMGCASHSRRTAPAWVRDFRASMSLAEASNCSAIRMRPECSFRKDFISFRRSLKGSPVRSRSLQIRRSKMK